MTRPVRTAADLGRLRPRTEAVVALDAMTAAGLCTPAEVAALLPGLVGCRGVRRLRAALDLCDPRAESPMETRTRLVLVDAGLPSPVPQHEVRDGWGRLIARIDLAYPAVLLAIEYDGVAAHVSSASFARDRRRQNALLSLGWRVLRFTADDVLRRPRWVASCVASALEG